MSVTTFEEERIETNPFNFPAAQILILLAIVANPASAAERYCESERDTEWSLMAAAADRPMALSPLIVDQSDNLATASAPDRLIILALVPRQLKAAGTASGWRRRSGLHKYDRFRPGSLAVAFCLRASASRHA